MYQSIVAIEFIGELSHLFYESVQAEHGLRDGDRWIVFNQTKFLYLFFVFNKVYSVNWEEAVKYIQSVTELPQAVLNDEKKEYQKLKRFAAFCCGNETHNQVLCKQFIELTTINNDWGSIISMMEKIEPDNYSGERGITKEVRDNFISALRSVSKGVFTNDSFHAIIKHIYRIRCNIFHGLKTFQIMAEFEQRERIKVYTDILIACIQVLFTKIELVFNSPANNSLSSYCELCSLLSDKSSQNNSR